MVCAVRIYNIFSVVPTCGVTSILMFTHFPFSVFFHSPVVTKYLKLDENELLFISSIIMVFIILLSESFVNMQLSP